MIEATLAGAAGMYDTPLVFFQRDSTSALLVDTATMEVVADSVFDSSTTASGGPLSRYAFSGDGKFLVVAYNGTSGNSVIVRLFDVSSKSNVFQVGGDIYAKPSVGTSYFYTVFGIDVSVGGSHVALITRRSDKSDYHQIIIIDSSSETVLYEREEILSDSPGPGNAPVFTMDGSKVTYGIKNRVWVHDINTNTGADLGTFSSTSYTVESMGRARGTDIILMGQTVSTSPLTMIDPYNLVMKDISWGGLSSPHEARFNTTRRVLLDGAERFIIASEPTASTAPDNVVNIMDWDGTYENPPTLSDLSVAHLQNAINACTGNISDDAGITCFRARRASFFGQKGILSSAPNISKIPGYPFARLLSWTEEGINSSYTAGNGSLIQPTLFLDGA